MTTKERYAGVIKWFQENKPIAETELQYHEPISITDCSHSCRHNVPTNG